MERLIRRDNEKKIKYKKKLKKVYLTIKCQESVLKS